MQSGTKATDRASGAEHCPKRGSGSSETLPVVQETRISAQTNRHLDASQTLPRRKVSPPFFFFIELKWVRVT